MWQAVPPSLPLSLSRALPCVLDMCMFVCVCYPCALNFVECYLQSSGLCAVRNFKCWSATLARSSQIVVACSPNSTPAEPPSALSIGFSTPSVQQVRDIQTDKFEKNLITWWNDEYRLTERTVSGVTTTKTAAQSESSQRKEAAVSVLKVMGTTKQTSYLPGPTKATGKMSLASLAMQAAKVK